MSIRSHETDEFSSNCNIVFWFMFDFSIYKSIYRSSKDFLDMHGLIMHVYNSDTSDLIVDHLGLHKALCILMGWNYRTVPDNMKSYQLLPADEAAANLDELILWPPLVIIHNTLTGKNKDGRVEGMGNRAMDNYIRGKIYLFILCYFVIYSAWGSSYYNYKYLCYSCLWESPKILVA